MPDLTNAQRIVLLTAIALGIGMFLYAPTVQEWPGRGAVVTQSQGYHFIFTTNWLLDVPRLLMQYAILAVATIGVIWSLKQPSSAAVDRHQLREPGPLPPEVQAALDGIVGGYRDEGYSDGEIVEEMVRRFGDKVRPLLAKFSNVGSKGLRKDTAAPSAASQRHSESSPDSDKVLRHCLSQQQGESHYNLSTPEGRKAAQNPTQE